MPVYALKLKLWVSDKHMTFYEAVCTGLGGSVEENADQIARWLDNHLYLNLCDGHSRSSYF
jgi:hypothetical protein